MKIQFTKCLIMTVFLFIVLFSVNASATVMSGAITNPANNHIYYLLTQDNWTNSQAQAVALGGDLVTINDAAENQWVLSTFSHFNNSYKTLWIGLTDSLVEGVFEWISGETSSYRNWSSGEPNGRPGEDFVHMYDLGRGGYSGYWNDYGDGSVEYGVPLHGVVEINPVPEPSTILLFCSIMAGFVVTRFRKKSSSSSNLSTAIEN